MAASAVLQTPPRPHRYWGDRFQGAHLRGAGQGAPAVSRLCGDQSRKALRPAGHPSRSARTHTHTHPVLVAPGAAVVPTGVPGRGPRVCGPPATEGGEVAPPEGWRLPQDGPVPRRRVGVSVRAPGRLGEARLCLRRCASCSPGACPRVSGWSAAAQCDGLGGPWEGGSSRALHRDQRPHEGGPGGCSPHREDTRRRRRRGPGRGPLRDTPGLDFRPPGPRGIRVCGSSDPGVSLGPE